MRRRNFLSAFILFLFIATPAWSYELSDVLSNIKKAETKTRSVSFDFEQNINFTAMDEKQVVRGKASFQKPNKLRISKTDPSPQETISNGKKVWVYNPTFNQVWVGQWKDWSKGMAFLNGMLPLQNYVDGLRKNFKLALDNKNESNQSDVVRIKATPKKAALGYSLELLISTQSWLPVKTTYVSDSAVVVTSLSGQDVNLPLSKNTFEFKLPPGTDVIPLN